MIGMAIMNGDRVVNIEKCERIYLDGMIELTNHMNETYPHKGDYRLSMVNVQEIGGVDEIRQSFEIDLQTEDEVIEKMRNELGDAQQEGLEMGFKQAPASKDEI